MMFAMARRGRPRKYSEEDIRRMARWWASEGMTNAQAAAQAGIHERTVRRYKALARQTEQSR
jgi:hypothetical protein